MSPLYLTVIEGPDAGRGTRADGELVVGRSAGAELVLADPSVSRRHAVVRPAGDTAVVEDLESSNGTLVNDAAITEPRRVGGGDVIRLGASALELRIVASEPATPTAEQTVVLAPANGSPTGR